MNSRALGAVLSALVLCSVAACGGAQTTGTSGAGGTPTVPQDLLALVPADPAVLVRVDVAAVRGSPYWATVSGWIGVLAGQMDGPADDLTRLLERTDELVWGVWDSEGGDDVLILARGSFQAGELERVFREAAAESGETVREKRVDGFGLLATRRVVGGHLDARTWITAPLARARAAIAAGTAGAPGLRSGETYRAIASDVGFEGGAVAVIGEVTPMVRAEAAQTAEHGGDEGRIAQLVLGFRRGGARLDVRDGLALTAIGDAASAEAARDAAGFVRTQAQAFGSSIPAMMLGVAPVLSRVDVQVHGTRATGSVRASDAEVRTILARLDGFVRVALDSGGSSTSGGVGAPEPPQTGP